MDFFLMFQKCLVSDGFFLIRIWMLRTKIMEVRVHVFYHVAFEIY